MIDPGDPMCCWARWIAWFTPDLALPLPATHVYTIMREARASWPSVCNCPSWAAPGRSVLIDGCRSSAMFGFPPAQHFTPTRWLHGWRHGARVETLNNNNTKIPATMPGQDVVFHAPQIDRAQGDAVAALAHRIFRRATRAAHRHHPAPVFPWATRPCSSRQAQHVRPGAPQQPYVGNTWVAHLQGSLQPASGVFGVLVSA